MTYTCKILNDKVKAYKDDDCVGIFDYEDFFYKCNKPSRIKKIRKKRKQNKFSHKETRI